ncbi:MAG TPA: DUF2306 domain-containing protein [Rhizomicrobium sp.]|nr:DUF2306 domain-containing protein [Rhizomicrobium sp.]
MVRFSRAAMAFLAVGVALYSFRFLAVPAGVWLGIDAGIRGVIERVPVQALTHMIAGPVALLAGPFQFIPGLRARHPRLHRWTGRTYVVACLVAGAAALATAPFASGGPVAGLGFGALAVSWIAANIGGWRAALAGNFGVHRIWMRFSYAMTFGAVTLRLQIPLGFVFFHFHSYSEMSVWLAYTSWIPNVIAVALYTALRTPAKAPVPAE